jgi:predicted adenylyl cyclase CyaB
MYEVELKTILHKGQKEYINKAIIDLFACNWESCIYHDTYYDTVNHDFAASERELRLRRILTGSQETILLTYKETPFDKKSKSKNEHEVIVNSYEKADNILKHLGYLTDVSFNKHCQVTQVQYGFYDINITLTDIEELSDAFMEIEVQPRSQITLIKSFLYCMNCLHY